MNRQEFDRIYVQNQTHEYPNRTVESALKCIKAPEQRNQVIEIADKRIRLSRRQAMEDVQVFFDCLKRCYSGYDFFFSDEHCERIQAKLEKKLQQKLFGIKNSKLCSWICEELKDQINDSHFTVYVCGREWRFVKKHIAYVTDLVVRKTKEELYEVIRGNDSFPQGYQFGEKDLEQYLLPTMIVGEGIKKQDKCYLLGKYTTDEISGIEIAGKWVQTHRIRSDKPVESGEQRLIYKENYVIVNHKTYNMPYDEELTWEYREEGVKCSKEKCVILNLTENGGGSSVYATSFYDGLCGLNDTFFIEAALPNPWELKDSVKRYEVETMENNNFQGSYDGTLYVVMNKTTASSAEMGVSPALHRKNSVLVGGGTYGCSTFGQCLFYQLPNSGIAFSYGIKAFFHESFEEGKGFLPDYWIDDEDPVSVVEQYIAQ